MTGKKWKLVVNPLSGNTPLHQFEIDAPNWMGALRGARKQLGEDGGLPSGSSCAVTPDGIVTILDPESRRKFVLTPAGRADSMPKLAADPKLLPDANQRNVKPAKFRTIAYAPSQPLGPPAAALPVGAKPAAPQPSAAWPMATKVARPSQSNLKAPAAAGAAASASVATASPSHSSSATAAAGPRAAKGAQVASERSPPAQSVDGRSTTREAADQNVAAPPTKASGATAASAPGARTKMQLELMLSRDVEPGPENPLTYRERAYLIPKGMSVSEAEAALRYALADLQQTFLNAPRGKFVNLAAFDHNWIDRPVRPPVVSLEWRDWRGEPAVDYPAASASQPPSGPEGDERLAAVFEGLHDLAHLKTAAEGLEFSVRLIAHVVPCEALSGCLYDINTDELRFVAVLGTGAAAAQGKAVSRSSGLFGKAAQLEHAALVIPDLKIETGYDPDRDGRAGLEATNMLLRPLTHDTRLLGMFQLINRSTGGFSAADVHVVNYIAERVAEFLREARARIRH